MEDASPLILMLIKVSETEKVPDIVRLNDTSVNPMILNAYTEGDKFVINHAQNIDPILQDCHKQRLHSDPHDFNFGEFEKIATIPEAEFLKHPEWKTCPNELEKWLRSDRGQQYRTSRRRI